VHTRARSHTRDPRFNRHPRRRGARGGAHCVTSGALRQALTRGGRFPHNPQDARLTMETRDAGGETSVHSRDLSSDAEADQPRQPERRGRNTPLRRGDAQTPTSKCRFEAPPRSDRAADHATRPRPHTTNRVWVATTRKRAAYRCSRQKVAQRVTIPIYRRDAAHRACPTQGGGGSYLTRVSGRMSPATDTHGSQLACGETRYHTRPRTAATARAA
jgi:hypothetical protein